MDEFSKKLDRILADTNAIKTDIKNIEDFQKNQKEKNELFEKKMEVMENRINVLDMNEYTKNVVFYGVEEGEKSFKDLYTKVTEIFEKAEIHVQDFCIIEIRRMGTYNNEIRPLIIKLIAPRYKFLIFEKEDKLKELGISVASDMPKEKRILKGKLLKARYLLRLQNKQPVIRGFNLLLDEKIITIEEVEKIISENNVASSKGDNNNDFKVSNENLNPKQMTEIPQKEDKMKVAPVFEKPIRPKANNIIHNASTVNIRTTRNYTRNNK